MSAEQKTKEDLNLVYALGLPGAGLLLASGILLLYYSFGFEVDGQQVAMADNLSKLGASGLDQIGRLSTADYSIGMVLAGAVTMIILNASAWRRTGGY